MNVERIKFERVGGFANMRIAADFELCDLSDEQVDMLKELLDEVDFAELPEHITSNSIIPDEFTYTITVEAEKWKHTVTAGDSAVDEKMQELFELLYRLARKKMRKH